MKVAFRDDDTSFFTKPEELKKAYDFMDDEDCVSLSVVPFSVPVHKDDVFPYGMGITPGYYDIEDNIELVEYLKKMVSEGKYNILLHGFSHEYQKLDGKWIPEMFWKDESRLIKELSEGKEKIDRVFGVNSSVFVAPNNCINQKGIHAIEKLAMDYSGIIQKNDRDVDLRYILNFIRRWWVRGINRIPYPGILKYTNHKELVAYTVDDYDRLVFEYEMCKKKGQPFVVYSHYWQINSDVKIKELLVKIYQYVKNDGASIIGLSDCFK